MKQMTFLIPILMVVFASCGIDEAILEPEVSNDPVIENCGIGYIDIHPGNVHFIKTIEADTIWAKWEHEQYGWMDVMWIDGRIDWSCVGFDRRCEDFGLIVMTRTDTCEFTIPGLKDCNL